jgi:ketosteroid isomerase-like protein
VNTAESWKPQVTKYLIKLRYNMNLYDLHSKPASLDHYDAADEQFPELFFNKYRHYPAELKKREQYIAKSAKYSYLYAAYVIRGPFKAGEAAISKDSEYSYDYAAFVLKGPFKLGEPEIAKNAEYSFAYARLVLKGPFKAGEPTIAKTGDWSYFYAANVLKGPFKLGEAAISKTRYKSKYEEFVGYKI